MKSSLLSIAGALIAVLFGLVIIQSAIPNPAPAPAPAPAEQDPAITWSATNLAATLFPGTSSTRTVSFRSNRDLGNVVIWITPSLDRAVSVVPGSFSSIAANKDYQLTLTLTVPPMFQKRIFGGTIHIKNAGTPPKTYDSPLAVNIGTDFGTYSNPTLGVSLDYPTNLFVIDPTNPAGPIRIQTSPLEINLGGALPEGPTSVSPIGFVIGISVAAAPQPFEITQWIASAYPNSEVDTISNTLIGGHSAYMLKFKNEVGSGRPSAVVPLGQKVFRFSYRSTFDPGSTEEQEGLTIFYSLLQSVSFP